MLMAQPLVKVLEHSVVFPPPGFFPPTTSLPLTFFDLPWLGLPPVEFLFFYSYQHNDTHFMNTTLPKLKHSLSLTLQHFFPLAGTFTWPPQATKPHVHCGEDNLSVVLTIAESSLDFNNLVGNHPRDVNEFFPLVASSMPNTHVDQVPAMALQVTLFSNTGICIAISFLHAIADGQTISHFMKSWASICKSGLEDDTSCLGESLPFYDRNVIHDLNNLETIYLNELATLNISQQCFYTPRLHPIETNKVRATFVLGQHELQNLKTWVCGRLNQIYEETPPELHLSRFVLMYAYVWVCFTKVVADENVDGMGTEHLIIPMDCRKRSDPDPPIPVTYFGNCLMPCFAEAKTSDLVGENGICIAAEAIGNAILHRKNEGILNNAEDLFTKLEGLFLKPRFLTVAGSPKLAFYGNDFGWGKLKKFEAISIEGNGGLSLSEWRDEEGGLEVGLILNKPQMDAFASLFTNTLRVVS